MRMLVKDTRSQDGIDDKDNDKGSKSRSQSMKEQAYNKEQRERPRPHELNDKSNLIDLMKEWLLVKQKDDGIFISQGKYVADILKKFDFATVRTASNPMETNNALLKDEEAADVDVHLYRSMIRSMMYLTASRSNIMFVVCTCARFQVTPKTLDLHAVKRIFRYLKGHPKLGLWYPSVVYMIS
ncbi:hypothetical protein Tco_1046823 [Tanacetum coccineum]